MSEVKRSHPELSPKKCEHLARKFIAQPRGKGGGHQTGDAVDIILVDGNEPVDMGTQVLEFNERTKTSAKTISAKQKQHRQILLTAMRKAEFANYPGEWWHYSYGDQMWAAYLRRGNACYDALEIAEEELV